MDSSSSFFNTPDLFSQAEPLNTNGATCDCYRVRLYGRLHFLKRLKEEYRTDPRYVAALQKEFEAGYNLDHPHIVRYLSCGDDYILMEYVDGEQLSDFVSNHPGDFATKSRVNHFLSQLLAAVDCLHQHGIVHLDLKPQNILITRVGKNVKLVDLGFCYTDVYPDTMGRTARYAAPEQYEANRMPDERTDIYAIGRIIEQFPCANKYRKIITRCTASQPEQRYQSVQELLAAIQPRAIRWRGIAAIGIVVALLAAFYLLWPHTSAPVADSKSPDTIMAPPATVPVVENMEDAGNTEDVQTKDENTQQTTVVAPTSIPSNVKPEQAATPAPTKKMSVTELREKLRSIAQPLYESSMGQLLDLPYHGNERLYTQMGERFDRELQNRFIPLSDQLEELGAVSQRTFMMEWSDLRLEYHNNTYNKMLSNEEKASENMQDNQ